METVVKKKENKIESLFFVYTDDSMHIMHTYAYNYVKVLNSLD